MAYFTHEFIEFFRELAQNNHRDWFHANKKRYDNHVKKPFYAFIQDIIDEMKKDDPEMNLEVKNAVFRINRDIRFSKDKTPYKNHVGAAVSRGGRKDMQYPGIYIHLEPGNVGFAGGCYKPDKENLSKMRHYIVHNPHEVNDALNDKKFKKVFSGLADGEKNKILPKDLKEFGDEHPLIFNKQFYYWKGYEDENILLKDDLLEFVMDHFDAGRSWNEVVKKALYS
ncbi:MAG: DUF2461 domain-containing protein [Saprospiraceae bacterium]|nr:DUF2461 domain-containing protein [Saprospiraceae bacterium]